MENDGDDGSGPALEAMRQQIMSNEDINRLKIDLGRAYQALALMMASANNSRKASLGNELKILQDIVYDIGAGISAIEEG